jgi:hypothetical protein
MTIQPQHLPHRPPRQDREGVDQGRSAAPLRGSAGRDWRAEEMISMRLEQGCRLHRGSPIASESQCQVCKRRVSWLARLRCAFAPN